MRKSYKITLASAIAVAGVGLTLAASSFAAGPAKNTAGVMQHDHPKLTQEQRDQMFADHQTKLKEKLDQAVKDTKLTQDQENHILNVFSEAHTKMEAKDFEGAKQLHNDLKKWMEDNKIDPSVLPRPPHGPHGPHGHGPKNGHPPMTGIANEK